MQPSAFLERTGATPTALVRSAAVALILTLLGGVNVGCGREKPATGNTDISGGGAGGAGVAAPGTGGNGMTPDDGVVIQPPSCDDLGAEPTIPDPCVTLMAEKASAAGTLTDEATLDTQRIQAAIDACPAGQSVKLATGGVNDAFLSGALFMKAGVTLWIDTGATLFASRDPRDFDTQPGSCGTSGSAGSACYGLIHVVKPDVAVVGAGSIDGRGGEVAIGGTQTWWALEKTYNGNLAAPRLIQVLSGDRFTLYQVTLRNAPKFHVVISNTQGYKVWGITINTPASAPNTDGVDPSASANGVIAYSKITTGDDNIAIKGAGLVDGLVIAHNHFGRGHGMSIGSETYGGVRNVSVCDLSLDGTTNGLRIKSDSSRGGVVRGIRYSDICMRSVTNPLVFDPYYSTSTGTLLPDFRDIEVRNVHVLGGGKNKLRGYDAAHPLRILFDNVIFDAAPAVTAQDAQIVLGPGAVTFAPVGSGVTVMNETVPDTTPHACDSAWATF